MDEYIVHAVRGSACCLFNINDGVDHSYYKTRGLMQCLYNTVNFVVFADFNKFFQPTYVFNYGFLNTLFE